MLDYRQIISHTSFKDFIPYSFYYSDDSIITKNGELLKVVKINLGDYNTLSNIRSLILDFISNYIEEDISIWITTIRSKNKDLFDYRLHDESYASSIEFNEQWKSFNGVDLFENELYISVIVNDRIDLTSLKNIIPFFSGFSKRAYNTRLNNIYKKLTNRVDKLISLLVDFSPQVLSIKNFNNTYFSEIETFFSRIIKSGNEPKVLSKSDISSTLVKNKSIEFLDNDIHLNDNDYAAVFTTKYHCELNDKIVFDILNNPFELVVTEIIFSNNIKVKKDKAYSSTLEKFSYFIGASNDKNLDFYLNNINQDEIFQKQTTVMIFGNKENINLFAFKMNEKLAKYGVIAYRENLAVEEVFWSQLPANFHQLARLKPVFLKELCNFNNTTEITRKWHDSLCFSDFYRYKEFFFLDQKNRNINFIFGDSQTLDYFSRILNLSFMRFDSLNILNCFEEEYLKINSEIGDKKDGCFLNVLTNIERDEIEKILFSGMEMVCGARNDTINESILLILNYFTKQKVLFNFQSFLNKLAENNLFNGIISNFQYDQNTKIKFLNIQQFHDDSYFNILVLMVIASAIQKLILKNDIVFFIKNFKVSENHNLNFKFNNLFNLIIEQNLYFYILYEGNNEAISKFDVKKENLSYFIFLNKNQINLYRNIGFTDENIKYFETLLQKNIKILMIKSENKVLSSNVNLEKFSVENNMFFEKK